MSATERPKAESRRGEDRYKALVEQLPVGVYRTTLDGLIVEANGVLARMLGYKKPRDLFTCNVKDFYVRGEDRARHVAKLTTKSTAFQEFELRRADGRKFWARDYCRGVKGPDGKIAHFDGILVDVTEMKTAERKLELALRKVQLTNEKLENLSTSDHLTGLNNRRGFFSFGLQQMKIAKRLKSDNYLVFLDIDNLKEVNDAYGHAVGDLLLQGVGTDPPRHAPGVRRHRPHRRRRVRRPGHALEGPGRAQPPGPHRGGRPGNSASNNSHDSACPSAWASSGSTPRNTSSSTISWPTPIS
ncbi:MAG: sensor domain-containing diguanylate cyclase [Candidatus Moduliflexus flocculans]|nr:sensor domain-containing diguanylate cyclase [Candidatus Moduliflexus flocculans]